jgi:hypothetical protein
MKKMGASGPRGIVVGIGSQHPRPFGSAQGRLCRRKRDKRGALSRVGMREGVASPQIPIEVGSWSPHLPKGQNSGGKRPSALFLLQFFETFRLATVFFSLILELVPVFSFFDFPRSIVILGALALILSHRFSCV